jgi:hypothetical protein
MISIREVITRNGLKKIILFPFELYKNDKNWVPPLIVGEWNKFDSKKNPSFEHCEAAYFLAYKGGDVVGVWRLLSIIKLTNVGRIIGHSLDGLLL